MEPKIIRRWPSWEFEVSNPSQDLVEFIAAMNNTAKYIEKIKIPETNGKIIAFPFTILLNAVIGFAEFVEYEQDGRKHVTLQPSGLNFIWNGEKVDGLEVNSNIIETRDMINALAVLVDALSKSV